MVALRTAIAGFTGLVIIGAIAQPTATATTTTLPPARYIPAATVKKAVFAHLTGQKLGKTYSQQTTKLYIAFQVQDRNLGPFYLFITAKGVPVHRFALKSGPYNIRYPAQRRVIVSSKVYQGVFGPTCELVEVYGKNVALDYTADAPGRKCPVSNPPSAFRQLDHILKSLPGA